MSPLRFQYIFALLALAAAVLLSGCRTTRDFQSPYAKEALEQRTYAVNNSAELLEALEQRTRLHDELWVKSDITIRQEAQRGKDFFTALVAFRAPDQLRLRGSRAPIGTVFEVLMNGQEAGLYFNREKRLFRGTTAELLEKARMMGGLTPMDLVSGVFVQQHLLGWMRSGNPMGSRDLGEHLLIGAPFPGGGGQMFWLVRKEDALIREVLLRSPEGQPILRMKYMEYDLAENPDGFEEPLPMEFEMILEGQGVALEADVSEYRLEPLNPALLERWPDARETYPLSQLEFEETE